MYRRVPVHESKRKMEVSLAQDESIAINKMTCKMEVCIDQDSLSILLATPAWGGRPTLGFYLPACTLRVLHSDLAEII